MRDIKQPFFFPSLIYVCRFVLPVIENSSSKSSAKVLTNYEKKKDSAGNMSMADEKQHSCGMVSANVSVCSTNE